MTALVTGASGFLGGRLAQVLAARGETVRVLVRPGRELSQLAGSRVQIVQGTLADTRALATAVEGVDRIYHCAACSTDWARWATYYQANVIGVRNLLAAARRVGTVRRFLHVSTTDVYGYPHQPCDESSPIKDVGLPYNRTKCLGEKAVWDAHAQGFPVTVVRPATIFGPRGTVFGTRIAKHLESGTMAVIDSGRASGGFCYVDNCVDAIIAAADSPQALGRAYNISDGTGATWREFVDALAHGLGLPRARIDIPYSIAFGMASLLETAYRAARSTAAPPLTRHAIYLLARNQEFPADRARKDFGMSPAVSFDTATARTVAWLRDQHE